LPRNPRFTDFHLIQSMVTVRLRLKIIATS
jgi:hypothetical protein